MSTHQNPQPHQANENLNAGQVNPQQAGSQAGSHQASQQHNQAPSVGRIVHFVSPAKDGHPSAPHAAVITEVNADGTVGLSVLATTDKSVKLGTEAGQWSWPPRDTGAPAAPAA
jgi:hypothetical protein